MSFETESAAAGCLPLLNYGKVDAQCCQSCMLPFLFVVLHLLHPEKKRMEATVVAILIKHLTSDINIGTGHKTSESGTVCGSGVRSCVSFPSFRVALLW